MCHEIYLLFCSIMIYFRQIVLSEKGNVYAQQDYDRHH